MRPSFLQQSLLLSPLQLLLPSSSCRDSEETRKIQQFSSARSMMVGIGRSICLRRLLHGHFYDGVTPGESINDNHIEDSDGDSDGDGDGDGDGDSDSDDDRYGKGENDFDVDDNSYYNNETDKEGNSNHDNSDKNQTQNIGNDYGSDKNGIRNDHRYPQHQRRQKRKRKQRPILLYRPSSSQSLIDSRTDESSTHWHESKPCVALTFVGKGGNVVASTIPNDDGGGGCFIDVVRLPPFHRCDYSKCNKISYRSRSAVVMERIVRSSPFLGKVFLRSLSGDETLAVGSDDGTLTIHDLNHRTTTRSGSTAARYSLERDRESVVSGSSYLCQKFGWDVSSSREDGGDAVGFMVARIDKNKGCIDVLPLGGSDRSNNATSNKSIVHIENDVTAACFWGEYGLVTAHGGGNNNSNATTTTTTNVIDHENNCDGIIDVSNILCPRMYGKSQRTSKGPVVKLWDLRHTATFYSTRCTSNRKCQGIIDRLLAAPPDGMGGGGVLLATYCTFNKPTFHTFLDVSDGGSVLGQLEVSCAHSMVDPVFNAGLTCMACPVSTMTNKQRINTMVHIYDTRREKMAPKIPLLMRKSNGSQPTQQRWNGDCERKRQRSGDDGMDDISNGSQYSIPCLLEKLPCELLDIHGLGSQLKCVAMDAFGTNLVGGSEDGDIFLWS